VERIKSGETLDEGFGLIRNQVSARALGFDTGSGFLLGEGGR